jgi:hypothetical protein
MNKLQTDIKKKVFSWSMMHNLQLIIEFHNMQYQMMKNQVSEININLNSCKDKNEKKKLLIVKDTYVNTFDGLLDINTFLLMYSHLEEFLYHTWKIFNKEQEICGSGSLKRFKSIIENVLKLDLNHDLEWELLCDYEKIRDCLLHANARVSISKNKNDLERIINKSFSHLSVKNDQIKLSGEFLVSVLITIESLIKRIDNASDFEIRIT